MKPLAQSPLARLFPLATALFLLACALPSFTATAAWAEGETVIVNAGFEQVDAKTGLPLDWTPWVTENQAVYTLATAHSGVASALVTDTDGKTSQGLRCQPVPIKAGRTYEASCWVNITDLKAGGFALYLEYWTGTERVSNVAVSSSKVGEWLQLKVSAPAPANAQTATLLIYGASAAVGTAYYDDAAISVLP